MQFQIAHVHTHINKFTYTVNKHFCILYRSICFHKFFGVCISEVGQEDSGSRELFGACTEQFGISSAARSFAVYSNGSHRVFSLEKVLQCWIHLNTPIWTNGKPFRVYHLKHTQLRNDQSCWCGLLVPFRFWNAPWCLLNWFMIALVKRKTHPHPRLGCAKHRNDLNFHSELSHLEYDWGKWQAVRKTAKLGWQNCPHTEEYELAQACGTGILGSPCPFAVLHCSM